jgi:hypothetical protein
MAGVRKLDFGSPERDWKLREAGPAVAESTVLLLPGGMCSAGFYAEVMAEPALARTRLVASTLPGTRRCGAAGRLQHRELLAVVLEATVSARRRSVSAP